MMKRMYIGLTIVVLITALNAYQHRDNYGETAEYTGFGFTFKYRADLTLRASGHPDYGGDATDLAGLVTAYSTSLDADFQNLFVEWRTVQEVPVLEDTMADYLHALETDSEIMWRETVGPMYVDEGGHQVAYWILKGTQREIDFLVVHAVWVEPWQQLRSNRMYLIGIVRLEPQDTIETMDIRFKEFMQSFSSG
jgi:hypothetical protein